MNSTSLTQFAPLLIGLIGVAVMAMRGCQNGPFGRHQLVNVSPEQELDLGRQAYREILSKSQAADERAPISKAVRDIGVRLARAAEDPALRKQAHINPNLKLEWEYSVLQDKQVNAFCLPGGKVAVFTGIVPVAETEAGLAVVMGHEIGHALLRHGAERMSEQQLTQTALSSAAMSMGNMDPGQRQVLLGVLGAGAQYGVILPFSRKNESEADHVGLLLMAKAGYDPREAARFWQRMTKATGGGKPSEWMSTHPSDESRIRNLEKWCDAEAMEYYNSAKDKIADRKLPPAAAIAPALRPTWPPR